MTAARAPRRHGEGRGGKRGGKDTGKTETRAAGRRRQRAEEPTAKRYRGEARHYDVEERDYEWHTAEGRTFHVNGEELQDLGAIHAAIANGEEVWSR